jgi:hypothetical protein
MPASSKAGRSGKLPFAHIATKSNNSEEHEDHV